MAGFHAFVDRLWLDAHHRRVSRPVFDRAFMGLTPDPEVLAKTHHQAEFVKPISDYLSSAVSYVEDRNGARAVLAIGRRPLEKADTRFGVDPFIVLGVWGLETNFGKNPGDLSTIRCLATLAYARYRGDYFRKELLDALDILQEGSRHVGRDARVLGGVRWARRNSCRLPSSDTRSDFDGRGRKDIWRKHTRRPRLDGVLT